MYYLLAQINLLGQGRDIEGWMDILILVVIAVIYGLGAIIKTAKRKKEEEEQSQVQIHKPQRKPPPGGRGILEQIFTEIKQAAEEARKGTENIKPSRISIQKTTPQQAGLQKYPGQAKPVSQIPAKAPPAKPKRSKSIPKAQSEFDELAQLDKGIQGLPGISTKIAGLPSKKKVKSPETVEYMSLSDVLSDYYKDPEEFKRAILHYEILGKPLALRSPDEGIIGL
jgi:hypothetical protein